MAQPEDIDLKDLVIEALEKNGSLAKIRALLRANVFLAFEDELEEKKYNVSLDKILKLPEGIVALSIVHEFLDFLNLKNTLFVYTAETRQGKDYKNINRKILEDQLNIPYQGQDKEPLLVSLVKNLNKINPRKFYDQGDRVSNGGNHKFRDDQNCTYIVHEDSSAASSSQSTSQSENSSDEKNPMQLRLPLDNSDTDTSSDSARDRTRSEYVPNNKILIRDESEEDNKSNTSQQSSMGDDQTKPEEQNLDDEKETKQQKKDNTITFSQYQLSMLGSNNNSDSTTYVELKPFNQHDEVMINTTGLPACDATINKVSESHSKNESRPKQLNFDAELSLTLSNASSIQSLPNSNSKRKNDEKPNSEYSYDFTTSPKAMHKDNDTMLSPNSMADISANNLLNLDSPRPNSHSSRSSVSISDVADMIELSEANSPHAKAKNGKAADNNHELNKKSKETDIKLPSDDSGDYSGSPIPSLSNLSLDFHSE